MVETYKGYALTNASGSVAAINNPLIVNSYKQLTTAELADHALLEQDIYFLNELKVQLIAHAADITVHAAADTTSFAALPANATDLTSAITLYTALVAAYNIHNAEASPMSVYDHIVADPTDARNDLKWWSSPGVYSGTTGDYIITIASKGGGGMGADTFTWTGPDGGAGGPTDCSTMSNALNNNINIAWNAVMSAHEVGDFWTISFVTPATLVWHNDYRTSYDHVVNYYGAIPTPTTAQTLANAINYSSMAAPYSYGFLRQYNDTAFYGHISDAFIHSIANLHVVVENQFRVWDDGRVIRVSTTGSKLNDEGMMNVLYDGATGAKSYGLQPGIDYSALRFNTGMLNNQIIVNYAINKKS